MAKSAGKVSKTANWTTIVYPESAPVDWLETLEGWRVRALVSPLHDRDVKKDGTPKKPHYHVILMWPGSRTRELAEKYTKALGGVGIEAVEDLGNLARYLTHENEPKKVQYSKDDVKAFGGVDYAALCARGDKGQVLDMIADIMDYCEENGIVSFAKLLRYARRERRDWFEVLCGPRHAVVYRFLRSLEYELDRQSAEERKKVVDRIYSEDQPPAMTAQQLKDSAPRFTIWDREEAEGRRIAPVKTAVLPWS